jgi:hypothetical protein
MNKGDLATFTNVGEHHSIWYELAGIEQKGGESAHSFSLLELRHSYSSSQKSRTLGCASGLQDVH